MKDYVTIRINERTLYYFILILFVTIFIIGIYFLGSSIYDYIYHRGYQSGQDDLIKKVYQSTNGTGSFTFCISKDDCKEFTHYGRFEYSNVEPYLIINATNLNPIINVIQ